MKQITEKIICDRCKKEITGARIRIGLEGKFRSWQVMRMNKADFCEECAKDIIDFALNKDACDECIRDMEDNAALLRAADEEMGASPNMEKYRDVVATYLGEPVRREGCDLGESEESGRQKEPDSGTTICIGIDMNPIEESKTNIKYMVPIENVAACMRTIHQDRQYRSGQHQGVCPADTHGTPQ